jgi:predicted DNA-binding protein (MmcQ/YjbR family)
MTLEELRKYCLSMKGVTESIKWEHHLCFSVGDKMFLITSPDEVPVNASFKTNDELFDELSLRKGMMPAPYLARNKWIRVDDIGRIGSNEWKKLMTIAYTLVFVKLTKKLQKEIEKK